MDLRQLFVSALKMQVKEFDELLEKAIDTLQKETGRIGNFTVNNRLVTLNPAGEALVIGDLHGDLESLNIILEDSGFLEKLEKSKDSTLIFLGDYGDRGAYSAEVYYVALTLKLAFPGQVILLRGNHEAPPSLLGSPHDLPFQFKKRFGEGWKSAYQKTLTLFGCFYNAVYVEERYLMVHGGLSDKISSLQDIALAEEGGNMAALEDLLWSDPDESIQGVADSFRGLGKVFGKEVTEKVLGNLNVKVLIRGHEACADGFGISHGGKVLTLFSRKGGIYNNKYGAYLQFGLERKFGSANDFGECIKKF